MRSVILEGLIVELKPDVNPVLYFGLDWLNVELFGSTNIFEIKRKRVSGADILREAQIRGAHPEVLWAEPIFLTEAIAHWQTPNDPFWSATQSHAGQWGLHNTSFITGAGVTVPPAWDRTRGSGTTIAIFDVGTQWNHPDLSGNMRLRDDPNPPNNGDDDDENGYIDDSYGWDFHTVLDPPPQNGPDGDGDPGPSIADDNHGTFCAGTATATTFNGQGVAGPAPDANLLILRIAQANPQPNNPYKWTIDESRLAQGIRYAAGEKFPSSSGNKPFADILSMSFDTDQYSTIERFRSLNLQPGKCSRHPGCMGACVLQTIAASWLEAYFITLTAVLTEGSSGYMEKMSNFFLSCYRSYLPCLVALMLTLISGFPALNQGWTNAHPLFYDIAASDDTYVVAGDMPLLSHDLIHWERTGRILSNTWTGIVFAQGRFSAIGSNGELSSSSDGKNWTFRDLRPFLPHPTDDVRYQGILHLNGKYFVLARGLLISSNAVDWEVYAKASDYEAYADIAYGNGVYVAVGMRGTIAVSSNAVDWVTSKPLGTRHLSPIAFYKSQFYAINVLNQLFTSPNGKDWSPAGNLPAATLLPVGDQMLGAVFPGTVYMTDDGLAWRAILTPSKMYLHKLRWLNGSFFAVGAPGVVLRSSDTENWSPLFPEGETTERFYSVAVESTNRLILGRDGAVLHGTAGGMWNVIPRPDSAWFYSVDSFNNQFVAAGWQGAVYTSPDGLSWARQETGTTNSLYTLSVANNRIFAGGYGFFLSSTNSTNWQFTTLHPNLSVSRVLFGAGRYVVAGSRISSGGASGAASASSISATESAVQESSSIMVSTNLVDWNPIPGDYGDFYCAAYGNGTFLLAGRRVAISQDGLQWRNVEPVPDYFEDAIFANGKFYLASHPGVLFVSPDGLNWNIIPIATSVRPYALAASSSSLIAVGEVGAIVEAPFDLYFGQRRKTSRGDRQVLYGASGPALKIESSTDLLNWTTYLDVQAPPNPYEFSPGPSRPIFFRAVNELE